MSYCQGPYECRGEDLRNLVRRHKLLADHCQIGLGSVSYLVLPGGGGLSAFNNRPLDQPETVEYLHVANFQQRK